MKLGKNLSGSSFFVFMGDRVIFVYQGFTMFLHHGDCMKYRNSLHCK